MPIFEYTCKDCGKNFEELVSRADDMVQCPSCKSTMVDRRLSVFAASSATSSSGRSCGTGGCGSGFS